MRYLGPTKIVDSYAEAFAAWCARLVVTAADDQWLDAALVSFCGYGTSVIACDAEVGVERRLAPNESPDGRSGAAVLAFGFRNERVGKAVANRAGQCLLTCPTAAVFDGFGGAAERFALGDYLRYFGDGHERRDGDAWALPLMEGQVVLPATAGLVRGVAGGNLIVQGRDQAAALAGATRGVAAMRELPGVITPFPGGVCRSGSKVGSRYRGLVASTNEAFCPTLHGAALEPGVAAAYEIIVNAIDEHALRIAMRAALHAAAGDGVIALCGADYGGSLGKVRIPLSELL
ncbi:MAG: formylmethanofuran--tetrahydromethanopterin N-formyltransferase [Lacipirellulaceae bacterium]